jgi:hypothetical protein
MFTGYDVVLGARGDEGLHKAMKVCDWMITGCCFTGCSLNVHWMFTECSKGMYDAIGARGDEGLSTRGDEGLRLNDHWMFTGCSLNVHWMFTECSQGMTQYLVHEAMKVCEWMITGCSLDVH